MNSILITRGAGFIGSDLCEYFLGIRYRVVCLGNLATGYLHNMMDFISDKPFTFTKGDTRNLKICKIVCKDIDIVLGEAVLGSVPPFFTDPIMPNGVNVSGYLNMIVAAKHSNVKRFIYAVSNLNYGDPEISRKVEDIIGKPLSPYADIKCVNELNADIFGKIYRLDSIGPRYFNVFGPLKDPKGVYAAVIPN